MFLWGSSEGILQQLIKVFCFLLQWLCWCICTEEGSQVFPNKREVKALRPTGVSVRLSRKQFFYCQSYTVQMLTSQWVHLCKEVITTALFPKRLFTQESFTGSDVDILLLQFFCSECNLIFSSVSAKARIQESAYSLLQFLQEVSFGFDCCCECPSQQMM